MRKLFINNYLFRLLSPVFSGVTVYLLILLINNNVDQLQVQFLGQELYVCIGLSFVIQELYRLLLIVLKLFTNITSHIINIFIHLVTSMLLCVIVVSYCLKAYYIYVLGFSINSEELWLFNIIFCSITIVYILLNISQQYLNKENTEKLNNQLYNKNIVEKDFRQFEKGINTKLLFDSFESLIVLTQKDKDKVDDLIGNIAAVYRYIFSQKDKQLTSVKQELEVLEQLISLFNYLPYINISIKNNLKSDFMVVPGSILSLIENIIRSTIISPNNPLEIELIDTKEYLNIIYYHNDKISERFTQNNIKDLQYSYNIYSDRSVSMNENESIRSINIPKLLIKQ
ncbi:MAG: histidine kinase [Flavobacteriaceae bacterium]|nr:histidine kinase [Flavobacteriaceae bacterium]